MGQTAALLVALGPRVAEIDVQPVHLRRGKHIRQQGGVPHHEEYVVQPRRLRPFHGHHHGVRHLLHGDEQNIRLRLGRTHGEAPPLPQPSSTRSARASGIRSRQCPRMAKGGVVPPEKTPHGDGIRLPNIPVFRRKSKRERRKISPGKGEPPKQRFRRTAHRRTGAAKSWKSTQKIRRNL